MALNWQDIANTARELQKSQRNDHQEKAKTGFLRDFHNEGHFLRRVLSMNDHDLCTEFTSQFGESMISHFDRSLIWLKNGICALETVVEKAVALRAAQTKLREESRTKAGKEQREEIRAGQRASEMPQEDSSEEEPSGSESDERKKTKRDQKKRRRNRRVRNKRRRDASSSESEVRKVRKKRSHSKTKKNNSAESSPSSAHRPYLDFHFSASSPSLSGVSDYDALLAEFHRRNEKKKKLSQAEKNEKQDTRQLALDKKEEHRRKLRVEAFQEQEDQDSRDFVTDDTDSSAYCAPVVSKPDGGKQVVCPLCKLVVRVTSRPSDEAFRTHLEENHSRNLFCRICCDFFPRVEGQTRVEMAHAVTSHIQAQHKGEGHPLVCPICKRFEIRWKKFWDHVQECLIDIA